MKKIISFLIGLAIIPCFVTAQVSINEIMYDVKDSDSGREWIELANFGGDPIDMDGWKFQESASSSNHTLSVIQGNSVIPSGGYAIIVIDSAKFLADWPGFSGTIFKASFSSLNNTASTLVIKNKNMEVQDLVGYSVDQGAAGGRKLSPKNRLRMGSRVTDSWGKKCHRTDPDNHKRSDIV